MQQRIIFFIITCKLLLETTCSVGCRNCENCRDCEIKSTKNAVFIENKITFELLRKISEGIVDATLNENRNDRVSRQDTNQQYKASISNRRTHCSRHCRILHEIIQNYAKHIVFRIEHTNLSSGTGTATHSSSINNITTMPRGSSEMPHVGLYLISTIFQLKLFVRVSVVNAYTAECQIRLKYLKKKTSTTHE